MKQLVLLSLVVALIGSAAGCAERAGEDVPAPESAAAAAEPVVVTIGSVDPDGASRDPDPGFGIEAPETHAPDPACVTPEQDVDRPFTLPMPPGIAEGGL